VARTGKASGLDSTSDSGSFVRRFSLGFIESGVDVGRLEIRRPNESSL
jgi:hypothetical protein